MSKTFRVPSWARVALTGVAAGTTALTLLAPAAGASQQSRGNTVSFQEKCSLGILGTQTLTGTDTATLPASVAHGSSISITGVGGSITIPAALAGAAYALGAHSVAGSLSTYDFAGTDVSPSLVNAAAKSKIKFGPLVVTSGSALTLTYPSTGTVTVGPFVATAAGKATFTLGKTVGTVGLYSSSNGTGTPITSIKYSCAATKTVTVGTVTVS